MCSASLMRRKTKNLIRQIFDRIQKRFCRTTASAQNTLRNVFDAVRLTLHITVREKVCRQTSHSHPRYVTIMYCRNQISIKFIKTPPKFLQNDNVFINLQNGQQNAKMTIPVLSYFLLFNVHSIYLLCICMFKERGFKRKEKKAQYVVRDVFKRAYKQHI